MRTRGLSRAVPRLPYCRGYGQRLNSTMRFGSVVSHAACFEEALSECVAAGEAIVGSEPTVSDSTSVPRGLTVASGIGADRQIPRRRLPQLLRDVARPLRAHCMLPAHHQHTVSRTLLRATTQLACSLML